MVSSSGAQEGEVSGAEISVSVLIVNLTKQNRAEA